MCEALLNSYQNAGVQFQPVYGEIPTMEWHETPIGMCYLTVRRWGDNLYLRVNDAIAPNICRIARIRKAMTG